MNLRRFYRTWSVWLEFVIKYILNDYLLINLYIKQRLNGKNVDKTVTKLFYLNKFRDSVLAKFHNSEHRNTGTQEQFYLF